MRDNKFLYLRQRAEVELLEKPANLTDIDNHDTQHLIHELRVHQIELEMQNEELRRSQYDLEQSRDRFVALYDSAPVGYLTINDRGTILEVNNTLASMLGRERIELFQSTFSRFIAQEDQDIYYLALRQTIKTNQPLSCTVRLMRKDKSHFYALLDGKIDDADQYHIVVSDITEQKQANDALLQQHTLLQTLIDAIPDYIFVKDREGRFIVSNDAHTAASNVGSHDALIGKTANDIFPTTVAEQFHIDDDHVMSTNQAQISEERRTLDSSGNKMWVSTTKVPLLDNGNNVTGLVGISRDITQRKLAEERLRASEKQLDEFFHASPAGLTVIDNQLRYERANKALAVTNGVPLEDHLGKTVREVLPKFAPIIEPLLRNVFDTGEPMLDLEISGEVPKERNVNGYWTVSYFPITESDGKIQAVGGVIIDITKRKKAEIALQESENRYRQAEEIANIGSWERDLINGVSSWSDGVYRICGIDSADTDLTYDKLLDIIHPQDRDRVAKAVDLTQYNNEKMDVEYRIMHSDQSLRTVHSVAEARLSPTGEVISIIGTLQDITERKQAEERLRESEEKLQALFTMLPVGVSVLDNENKIVQMNLTLEKILDMTYPNYLAGKDTSRKYIHSDGTPLQQAEFPSTRAVNEQQAIFDVEIGVVKEDGEIIWTSVSAAPLSVSDLNAVIITTDITERKQAEKLGLEHEHLKTQFQKEQEQTILIGNIISSLSYDMRTPLSVISMARDMLDRYFDKLTVQKRQEKLNMIDQQVQFALQLLDDTVQMARGRQEFNPTLVNLDSLCQISIDEIHLENESTHKLIFNNINKVKTVILDETLVSRILLNLLSNAIKYSPEDSEIRLELDKQDDSIILSVVDYGIGIKSDNLLHIFELLYRGDNVGDILGTGLGLSIVKDCVERHQGIITVHSEVGKGTTFTVELPV